MIWYRYHLIHQVTVCTVDNDVIVNIPGFRVLFNSQDVINVVHSGMSRRLDGINMKTGKEEVFELLYGGTNILSIEEPAG